MKAGASSATVVQEWGTTSTYTWTPSPSDTGEWLVQVNVRSDGATEMESYRNSPHHIITPGDPAVVTALTPDRASPTPQGTAITWTPQITGGVAPLQYKFWRMKTGASSATVVQEWGTTSTYTWTPSASDTGEWVVQVNVRSDGATEMESYRNSPHHTITLGDPAIVTALTADQASPTVQGTAITWTPQVSGGAAPLQYRYWRMRPGTAPSAPVQDWSTTSTYTWTPSASETGEWSIQVNVRSAGATEMESYRDAQHTVSPP